MLLNHLRYSTRLIRRRLGESAINLFGLATFAARRRRREISVRKVFGAKVMDIVTLMTRGFLLPIGIAVLVVGPVAWIASRRWLGTFAFHFEPGPGLFAAALGIGLVFALLPLLGQAVRAGLVAPREGLRDD